MVRSVAAIVVSVLFLLSNVSAGESANDMSPIEATLKIVDNIEAFKLRNADLTLTPLTKSVGPRQQILYTVGSRISGDRQVAANSNNQSWPTLQDVTLRLTYPVSGLGATVTYVQILVNQSSASGRAYIASGGVGQRFIQIIVEAQSTSYFNYVAQIYGY